MDTYKHARTRTKWLSERVSVKGSNRSEQDSEWKSETHIFAQCLSKHYIKFYITLSFACVSFRNCTSISSKCISWESEYINGWIVARARWTHEMANGLEIGAKTRRWIKSDWKWNRRWKGITNKHIRTHTFSSSGALCLTYVENDCCLSVLYMLRVYAWFACI